MSETSRDLGALGAGIGIGFFVYLFVGLGGGFGGRLGRGGSGTSTSTLPAPAPSRPRDAQMLLFLMTSSLPMEFRLMGDPDQRSYALEELIARVKAGGRQDVALNFRGDIRHGATEDAVTALKAAGLVVYPPAEFKMSPPKVSGSTGRGRGRYA